MLRSSLLLSAKSSLVISHALHSHTAESAVITEYTGHYVSATSIFDTVAPSPVLTQQPSVSITTDNTLHSHVADSLTLVVIIPLTVANTSHNHTSDSPTFVVIYLLTVNGTQHTHAADNIDLIEKIGLTIANCIHYTTSQSPTLSTATFLTVSSSDHSHVSESLSLTQKHYLTTSPAVHSHTSEKLSLSVLHVLNIASTLHQHTVDSAILTQGHLLSISNALHGHICQSVQLLQVHNLLVNNTLHNQIADNIVLIQQHQLSTENCIHLHLAQPISLAQTHILSISVCIHSHTVASITLAQEHNLNVGDTLHQHLGDNITLSQVHFLSVDDSAHLHSVSSVDLTRKIQAVWLCGTIGYDLRTAVGFDGLPAHGSMNPYGSNDYFLSTLCATDGTVKRLSVYLPIAPGGVATRTFTFRINEVSTDLSVSFGPTESGFKTITTDVAISAGQRVSVIGVVSGGTAVASVVHYGIVFESSNSEFPMMGGSRLYGLDGVNTYYYSLAGLGGYYTNGQELVVPPGFSGKVVALSFNLEIAPGAGESRTISLEKNYVTETALQVSYSDSENGTKTTTGEVPITEGDILRLICVPSGAATTSRCQWGISVRSNSGDVIVCSINGLTNASSTAFRPLQAGSFYNYWHTTETKILAVMPADITAKSLGAYLSYVPGVGKGYTFSLRDDGQDSSLSVEVADTETSDTVTQDTPIAFKSLVNIASVPANGPTSAYPAFSVRLEVNALPIAVADAKHSHTAESPTLTQEHNLAVSGCSHIHTAEPISLTVIFVLVIDGATHVHSAANIQLTLQGSLSDTIELELLDHILKVESYTPPSTVYLALSLADPGEPGSGLSEPSGGNYAREVISFSTASARVISQSATIAFTQATGNLGTITHWAIMDTLTGGTVMAYGPFSAATYVLTGTIPNVGTGEVAISVESGGFFTAYANDVLDWLFRGQALAQPGDIYLAASTTEPNDTGNVTEPNGGGYSRVTHNTWRTATLASSSNSGTISFSVATASWGTIVALVGYSGATPMFYSSINNVIVSAGNAIAIADGSYVVDSD